LHVVVVGAGILGASIAYHLTLHGVRVTILDAGQPGEGATRVSFGWLNAYGKTPFAYHNLNRRSIDMWGGFASRLGIDVTWGGELRWAVTADGAAALAAQAEELQAWGYPTRILDAAEVRQLEPGLQFDEFTIASYTYSDGHVDTPAVVQACLVQARERGAVLRTGSLVTGMEIDRSHAGAARVEAVRVGEETVPCDAVVLAGGADMPALAEMAGIQVPHYHTFGATLLTRPLPPLFQNIALLHSPRERQPLINVRQLPSGAVMMQSGSLDNTQEGDRGATDAEAAQIAADAGAVLPVLREVEIAEVRRGRRPIPKDGRSIVGFAPEAANVYVATTHSGVTLAPLLGAFAAIEIAHGARIELLAPFRPDRFANSS
jgi:glycine/D-amino acid oxidase-like deaminating enzyme